MPYFSPSSLMPFAPTQWVRPPKRWITLLCVSLLTISPMAALADGPDDGVSKEDLLRIIQKLEQRVEQLEAQQSKPAVAPAVVSKPAPPANVKSLEQRIDAQQQQIERQQAQLEAVADAQESTGGSNWFDKVSLGGYGELHYNNLDAESSNRDNEQIDFHRFVLFLGYDFTDDIRFFSEVELEHSLAGEGQPGEVELEQAFVEFDLLNDRAAARAGIFLLPIGILNETHEPNTFYGVERNDVENIIIPSTWWAGGVGYTQRFGNGFQFDVAVHEGLEMPVTGGSAFRVRSGRQKTAEANAEDLAGTARLKYTGIPGVELGGSLHYQKDASQASKDGLGDGLLYEIHVAMQRGRFGFRALYAEWDFEIDKSIALPNNIADAVAALGAAPTPAEVAAATALATRQVERAEDQHGWYVEPSWKLFEQLGIYTRYEEVDGVRDQDNFDQWEVGFNYWPHEQVVLKVDWRSRDHEPLGAQDRDFDGFDLGVGYQF